MIAEITSAAGPAPGQRKVRVTFYMPKIGLAQSKSDMLLDTYGAVTTEAEEGNVIVALRAACDTLGIPVRS
ncbi:MAG: hypothetical protein ABW167_07535 [Baekduia sp.]